MIIELKTNYPTARKEHKCMYCGGTIKVGEKYEHQTNIYEGQIYDWVSHPECTIVAVLLDMFENYNEGGGVDHDYFVECLQEWLYDKHYNDETDTYDEGFDPPRTFLSRHCIEYY